MDEGIASQSERKSLWVNVSNQVIVDVLGPGGMVGALLASNNDGFTLLR